MPKNQIPNPILQSQYPKATANPTARTELFLLIPNRRLRPLLILLRLRRQLLFPIPPPNLLLLHRPIIRPLLRRPLRRSNPQRPRNHPPRNCRLFLRPPRRRRRRPRRPGPWRRRAGIHRRHPGVGGLWRAGRRRGIEGPFCVDAHGGERGFATAWLLRVWFVFGFVGGRRRRGSDLVFPGFGDGLLLRGVGFCRLGLEGGPWDVFYRAGFADGEVAEGALEVVCGGGGGCCCCWRRHGCSGRVGWVGQGWTWNFQA